MWKELWSLKKPLIAKVCVRSRLKSGLDWFPWSNIGLETFRRVRAQSGNGKVIWVGTKSLGVDFCATICNNKGKKS